MRFSSLIKIGAILLGLLIFSQLSLSAQENSVSTYDALILSKPWGLPRLTADTTLNEIGLAEWRKDMSETMRKLMKHPNKEFAPPKMIGPAERNGYRIERWQTYPFEGSTVNFYALVPDGVSVENPAKGGVLCIPGFGQTKELLAGERWGNYNLEGECDSILRKGAMARHFVEKGFVAVVVDNPSFGELSDNGESDYLYTSRLLLEQDWSYLGLTSWQDKIILDWLKSQPYVDKDHIIVSGFSLGTEPMMVLGLLDNEISAFVYNDFLCRTKERIHVMNKPDENGRRDFPNSIEHLIPGFLLEFDFPDIVAALSPRPVICTEGGLDRDFEIISKVYEQSGAPEAFTFYHYKKYEDPASRKMRGKNELSGNLSRSEFFDLVNVDPSNHYFKTEYVMPWIESLLD